MSIDDCGFSSGSSAHSHALITRSKSVNAWLAQSCAAGTVDADIDAPPAPWKSSPCRDPLASVNSLSSMPILRSTHSKGSHPPVATAIVGMSPSLSWLAGASRGVQSSSVSWHAATYGIASCLRHFPSWSTSGMLPPVGHVRRGRTCPSGPVSVATSGEPLGSTPH